MLPGKLLLLLLYAYDRAHAIPTVPKPDKIAADIPKPPKRVPAGDAAAKEPRAGHAQTGRTPSAVGKGTEAENVKAQHAKIMYEQNKEEKAELTRMKDNGWVTDKMLADWKEEPEQSVASFAYTAALALGRERQIGGSGGSLEPPGPLLGPPGPLLTHLHTVHMAYYERLPSSYPLEPPG